MAQELADEEATLSLEVPIAALPGVVVIRLSQIGCSMLRVEGNGQDWQLLEGETVTIPVEGSNLAAVIEIRDKDWAKKIFKPATIYDDLKALARMQKKYPKRIRKMFMKFTGKLLSKAEIGD